MKIVSENRFSGKTYFYIIASRLIGGNKSPISARFTTEVLEISFNIASLKNIVLDHVARNTSSDDGTLVPSKFPLALKNEIETCRAKFYICGAEEGCPVCQYAKKNA